VLSSVGFVNMNAAHCPMRLLPQHQPVHRGGVGRLLRRIVADRAPNGRLCGNIGDDGSTVGQHVRGIESAGQGRGAGLAGSVHGGKVGYRSRVWSAPLGVDRTGDLN